MENKTEKKKKKIIIPIIIGAILLVGLTVGLTYAYWVFTASQTTVNKIVGDCLEISFEEKTDAINLDKAYPISDEEAEKLSSFTFAVSNTCNAEASFDVNLEVMDVENRLSSNYVAMSFNGEGKSLLSTKAGVDPTYDEDDYTAVEAYKIGGGRLAKGESKTFTLKLWMDASASNDAMNKTLISKVVVTAGVAPKEVICKRATTLHTETCSNSSTTEFCGADGYTEGSTITYGNLGNTGTLASGDAFDCDVNGDGNYDSATERFYYVSDYYDTASHTYDSGYATLVYYNDISGGVATSSTPYAYGSGASPDTASAQLPTTTQWSNVSLVKTSRDIRNNMGAVLTSGFSYAERAARLLTHQEVSTACSDGVTNLDATAGISNKCQYLLENTKYSNTANVTYGSWLETIYISDSTRAWSTTSDNRKLCTNRFSNGSGVAVRPVIEVAKSKIDY